MVQSGLKFFPILFLFVIVSCENSLTYKSRSKEKSEQKSLEIRKDSSTISNHPKICNAWELVKKINKKNSIKILDVRKIQDYETGHIPGALQVWRNDFNEEKNGLKSFRASKDKMEILLSRLGIENEDSLILYDDRGGVNAARIWFVLNYYGFKNIRFLNGGIDYWKSLNYPLETVKLNPVKTSFSFSSSGNFWLNVELEELVQLLPKTTLLDSRTKEEFRGEIIKPGASRGGRIPNAIRFDYSELTRVGKGEDHCFNEPWDVLAKLEKLSVNSDSELVVYCQSGARSALLAFYFREILGWENVRNYDGSWIEWSSHDELIIEQG